MQLNKKAFGLALGLVWGVWLLIMTIWVMLCGGGNHLALFNQFYPGYAISYLGAILGLLYGFVSGYIGGWLFAGLYNKLAKK